MKSNRKLSEKKEVTTSRFSSRYKPQKGRLWIFIMVFIMVVAVMVYLMKPNQTPSTKSLKPADQAVVSFTLEGELTFFKRDGSPVTTIDIEIADDDYQRERGLMYRRTMEDNQGMLFIFGEDEFRSFWMKNTHLPLDIMYLDANKIIVDIHESTVPYSEVSVPSSAPARYVVEVVAGFSARHLLSPGDSVSFKRIY